MTQQPPIEREERRKEIERTRNQNALQFLQGSATGQALAHPGRAYEKFWDESNLPGILKAPLGIGSAALHGIGDFSGTDEEFGRAATGNLAYAMSLLPGNDHDWAERVQSAFENTPGGIWEKGRAANEGFAEGHEREAWLINQVLQLSNLISLGGAGVAKLGVKTGIKALAPVARGAVKVGDIAQALENLPLKPFTHVGGKLVQQVIQTPAAQVRMGQLAAQAAKKAARLGIPWPPTKVPPGTLIGPALPPTGPPLDIPHGPPARKGVPVPPTQLPSISYQPGNVPRGTPIGPAIPPELGPAIPPEYGPPLPTQGNLRKDQLPLIGRKRQYGPEQPPVYGPAFPTGNRSQSPVTGNGSQSTAQQAIVAAVARHLGGPEPLPPEAPATSAGELLRRYRERYGPLSGETPPAPEPGIVMPPPRQGPPVPPETPAFGQLTQRPSQPPLPNMPGRRAAAPLASRDGPVAARVLALQDQLDPEQRDLLNSFRDAVERGDPEEIRNLQETATSYDIPPEILDYTAHSTRRQLDITDIDQRREIIEQSPTFAAFRYIDPKTGDLFLRHAETRAPLTVPGAGGRPVRLTQRNRADFSNVESLPGGGYDEVAANILQNYHGPDYNPRDTGSTEEFWAKAKADFAEYRKLQREARPTPYTEGAGGLLDRPAIGRKTENALPPTVQTPEEVAPRPSTVEPLPAPPEQPSAAELLRQYRERWPEGTPVAPEAMPDVAQDTFDTPLDRFRTQAPDTEEEYARRLQSQQAYKDQHGLGALTEDERQTIRGHIDRQFLASAEQTARAYPVARRIELGLQGALPGVRAELGGSFASGKFTSKGVRDFDLDYYLEGDVVDPATGQLLPAVREQIRAARAQAKKAGTYADFFVSTNGQDFYGVTDRFRLTNDPGLFGKDRRTMTRNGVSMRGGKATWDEVAQKFRADLGTFAGQQTPEGVGAKASTYDPNDPHLLRLTPALRAAPTRLGQVALSGAAGGAVGALAPADTEEERRANVAQGALLGAGGMGALTSGKATRALTKLPVAGALGKNLLQEALNAQKAAMARPDKGIGSLKTLASVWRVQATSTLKNLLQDEGTARAWLADAGVRSDLMNKNWASLVELFNLGERDPYHALPEETTNLLDALGMTGYEPQVGASFTEINAKLVKDLSAMDSARAEGLMALAHPLQGGVPVLGAATKAGLGYTRAFQQSLFDNINMFTRIASRHAAFQDTLQKELPDLSRKFLAELEARGGNKMEIAALRGRDGLFSPDEIEAIYVGGGDVWTQIRDEAVKRAEARSKDILGDFSKEAFPGERQIGKVLPFSSYALRAYPRIGKMMLHHPGISLAIMTAMASGIKHGQQAGLPGYLAGSIPIDEDTPVVGGLASALGGGAPGKAYIDPLSIMSPVGAEALTGGEMPEDATTYQKAANLIGRGGFGFSPLIQQAMFAMNQDYRPAGALSRTAGIEAVAPGPQLPSLIHGPSNFIRKQFGGSPVSITGLDRQKAEVFYRLTGRAMNDPEVTRDPQLTALLQSSLDPNSPLSQQALREEQAQANAKFLVGTSVPVQVSARSDVQLAQDRNRVADRALPPARYDPAAIKALQNAPDLASHLQAMKMRQANEGTQATPNPASSVTSNASRTGRAYLALEAWQRQNVGLKQFDPRTYAAQEEQIKTLLGI